MKLTIAFITKDRCSELKKAINSCIDQNFNETQYIVVDNGSSDETLDYLKKLEKNPQMDIKVYLSEKNLGVAGGRNKAMELADGEYVFFLDDDAAIESENLLTTICEYMDISSDVAALALRTYEEKTERYLEGPLSKRQDVNGRVVDTLQFVGAAHVLRKSLFNADKLYPSNLGYGSEELYASLRIWKRNYSIKYLRDVMVRHIPSTSNRLNERERQYNILTNTYVVKMLTYPLVFRLITKLVFELRLVKNRYADKKTRAKFRADVNSRYQVSEEDRLTFAQIWRLAATFGWRNIL